MIFSAVRLLNWFSLLTNFFFYAIRICTPFHKKFANSVNFPSFRRSDLPSELPHPTSEFALSRSAIESHSLQPRLWVRTAVCGWVGGLVTGACGAPYSTPATYGLSCPLAPPLSDFQGLPGSSRPGRNLILLQRLSAPPHLAAAPPEICISTNPSVVGFSRR